MIIGIGNDITDIRRIEKGLERHGARFEQRFFTEGERKKAKGRGKINARAVAATYAKRFAAKEATAKALGSGISGISWREIEVKNAKNGAPLLMLHGKAAKHLASLLPRGYKAKLWLSMSDDYPYAQSFVIIEAVEK